MMLKIINEKITLLLKATVLFSLIFSSLLYVNVVQAKVKLAAVFTDNMVLQRNLPINIWGRAAKYENIKVALNGKTFQGQANKAGVWLITLPPQQVAIKQSLRIAGKLNTIELSNIAFGDVWLASGQSNMSFTLEKALKKFPQEDKLKQYPDIRQFYVAKHYNFKGPLSDLKGASADSKEPSANSKKPHWQVASSETVGNFSAVAWFFAKDLYKRYQVPIGIINSSVGGTAIDSWMSYQSLKNYPKTQALAYKLRDDDYVKQLEQEYIREVNDWLAINTEQDKGLKHTKWSDTALDDSQWPTLKIPGNWEHSGVKFKNGVIWLRKDFSLSKKQSESDANLLLGNIIEADQTFVNGFEVGRTPHRYFERDYFVDSKLLKSGINNITMRIEVNKGQGGTVQGKPYRLVLQEQEQEQEQEISLNGDWKYQIGVKSKPLPWNLKRRTNLQFKPVGLYNAMIAPLAKVKFSGVIWYQGEGNVNQYQSYSDQFSTMIHQWRDLFEQPKLPFLFVQLANFQKPNIKPVESSWAALRDAQTQVLNTVENTAMALAIDVGEWNDIHPLDKKTVGERLALGARHLVYGEKQLNYTSPLVDKALLNGGRAIISFKYINKRLMVKGDKLMEFAIAGADKKFIWANAKLQNNQITVWHEDIKAPKYVRYAWANNPDKANLFNDQGLPATPFTVKLTSF